MDQYTAATSKGGVKMGTIGKRKEVIRQPLVEPAPVELPEKPERKVEPVRVPPPLPVKEPVKVA